MPGRTYKHKIVTIAESFFFQGPFSLPLPSLLLKLPITTTGTATTTPLINDLIGGMWTKNRAARAARFLVQLYDVVCQMTTWKFHI